MKETRNSASFILHCARVLLPRLYRPPIIIYHSVTTGPLGDSALSLDSFTEQMGSIRHVGYSVAPLEVVVSGRKISKMVFLTFDDGADSFYDTAWPVIKRYNYPVAVFIIAERIGSPGYMGAGQLRELVESGLVTIGSHTMRHRYLPELGLAEIEDEVARSKTKIEETISRCVNFLAYPWGGFNEEVKEIVKKAGYLAAFTTNQGLKRRGGQKDYYAIKRMTITGSETVYSFIVKISGLGTCFSRVIKG